MSLRSRAALGVACLALLSGPAVAEDARPSAPAAPELSAAQLLERVAPTIVSVKYVLKSSDGEAPGTALGSAADPTGLIVLSNDSLGTSMASCSGCVETRALDLRVMFGSDPKEWPAVVVARDAVLSLGWIQVVGLEGSIPAVDFSKGGADPVLGTDLRTVWRAGRGFDFAPVLARHYVSAVIKTPRTMWNLSGDTDRAGLAVFDVAGRPVGAVATQTASAGEDEQTSGTFLLPLADVRKSLEKAKKLVPDALAKAAKSEKPEKTEKPDEKPGTAPDATPKDAPKETPKDAPGAGPR